MSAETRNRVVMLGVSILLAFFVARFAADLIGKTTADLTGRLQTISQEVNP